MQDPADQDAATAHAARQAELQISLRRARQARVGLLRNPNRAPPPPLRRPPLMGRHLSLRSSRRPKPASPAGAELSPEPAGLDLPLDAPLIEGEDGRIARIDVDRLERLAESLAPAPRPRAAFAESVLGRTAIQAQADLAQNLRTPPNAKESGETGDAAPSGTAVADGWRGLLSRWIGRG